MHTSKLVSYVGPFLSCMCRISLYANANINHKILTGETTDEEQWKRWEYMFAVAMLRHVFYCEWWQSEYQQSRSEIKNNNKRMVCWEDVCHVCHWDVHASIEVFFVGFAGVVAECQQSRSEIKNEKRKKKKEWSVGEMCNMFAIGMYMLTLKCSLQGLQEWCQQSRPEIKDKEKNGLSGRCIPYLPLVHAYVEVCSVGFFQAWWQNVSRRDHRSKTKKRP